MTVSGSSLRILNNQDYPFILRDNFVHPGARVKPPGPRRVENDIVLLDESAEGVKLVRQVVRQAACQGRAGAAIRSRRGQIPGSFQNLERTMLGCHA